jgi:hypothetical protein
MTLNVYRVTFIALKPRNNKAESHLGVRPAGPSQYVRVAAANQEEAVAFARTVLRAEQGMHLENVFTMVSDVELGVALSADMNLAAENETLKASLAATQEERARIVSQLTAEIEALKAKA